MASKSWSKNSAATLTNSPNKKALPETIAVTKYIQ